MQTAHPAPGTPELRLDITATSYLAFTVCASIATTPDIHPPGCPRAQHRSRQASPSQLNFLATELSLRTSRPPPCRILPGILLETSGHLVRQIAASHHSHRTFLFTILPFSILQWPRLSNGRTPQQHQVREQWGRVPFRGKVAVS